MPSPDVFDLNHDLLRIVQTRYERAELTAACAVEVARLGALFADRVAAGVRITAEPDRGARAECFYATTDDETDFAEATREAMAHLEVAAAAADRSVPAPMPDPVACRARLVDDEGAPFADWALQLELRDAADVFRALCNPDQAEWEAAAWEFCSTGVAWSQAWFILTARTFLDVCARIELDVRVDTPSDAVGRLIDVPSLRASVILNPGPHQRVCGPVALPCPPDPNRVLDRVQRGLLEIDEPSAIDPPGRAATPLQGRSPLRKVGNALRRVLHRQAADTRERGD